LKKIFKPDMAISFFLSGLVSFQLWLPGESFGGAGQSMLWWLLARP
jgi:hypothetical protein